MAKFNYRDFQGRMGRPPVEEDDYGQPPCWTYTVFDGMRMTVWDAVRENPPEGEDQCAGRINAHNFYCLEDAEKFMADSRLPALFEALYKGASMTLNGYHRNFYFGPVMDIYKKIDAIYREYRTTP